ncbi:MAG TPA: RNA polymerase sigma factor [Vicinamibacterales bacterium]|nr:RNA polymerase sigma factor [Vicinamibacterales bacterium]
MHESASPPLETLVTLDAELEHEFEERLRESSGLAVRVAYGVLRRREDAEEVAQEAFAKAYRRFRQLRDRGSFRVWLVRMTWRMAIDRWRADRRRAVRELSARCETPRLTEEATAAENERADRLWSAIENLPEKLRQAIVLSAIQGYDVREVARLLGLPEGTVKSRLFLARKGLLQRLQCLASDTRPR